ncbi:hypothetical protein OROMI_008358 [Orobanche minor]
MSSGNLLPSNRVLVTSLHRVGFLVIFYEVCGVEVEQDLVEESDLSGVAIMCLFKQNIKYVIYDMNNKNFTFGNSKINQQPAEKEAVVSKRRCLRRQSGSSKLGDDERTEDMFDINKMPSSSRRIYEAGPTVSTPSAKEILTNGSSYYASELEAEARRTSAGRPLRKAVGKVQSYKEKSLSVKMRRSE